MFSSLRGDCSGLVAMVRKQSKRSLPYTSTHSPPVAVDSLQTTIPPNYYTSRETDYDLEKKTLEEVNKGKESKHEDGDFRDTSIPQEHSGDEAGM